MKRRRFCAQALVDCDILVLPVREWELLRECGAVSVSHQMIALVKTDNREGGANSLLASYLRIFKSFSTIPFDDLLEISSKMEHKQYLEFEIISDDIYALGPAIRTSHLILSGDISTHNMRKDGVESTDFENAKVLLLEKYRNGELPPIFDLFGPALSTATCGDMLHKTHANNQQWQNPLKSITTSIVETALVPADDICSIMEQTSQSFYRLKRCQQILEIAPEERQASELNELVKMLNAVKIFEHFPQTCLRSLARVMKVRSFECGEVIFQHGDDANEVFIVLTGILAAHVQVSTRGTRTSLSPQRHRRTSISPSQRSPVPSPLRRRLSVSTITQDALEGQGRGSPSGASRASGLHASLVRAVRKLQENPDALVVLKRSGDIIGDSIFSSSGNKRSLKLVAKEKSWVAVLARSELEQYRELFISSMVCIENVKNVLQTIPAIRSDDDLMMLVRLLREAPIFRAQSEQFLVSIARMMTLNTIEKGSFLFSEGSASEYFYLVLTGRLALCKGNMSQITTTLLTATGLSDLRTCEGLVEIIHAGQGIQDSLKRVAMNGPGPFYVFRQGAVWRYSCIALEATEILQISKQEYEQCVFVFQQTQHDQVKGFLSALVPFKNWKPKDCSQLVSSSHIIYIDRGSILFAPGQTATFLYVIQNGQCALYREQLQMTRGQTEVSQRPSSLYVRLVGKGMLLGLDVSIADGKFCHSLGCRADTPCTIILINRSDVDDVAGRNYCEQELARIYSEQVRRRQHDSQTLSNGMTTTTGVRSTEKSPKSPSSKDDAAEGRNITEKTKGGNGAIRIALNAAMMCSIEPEPAVVTAQALRADISQLRLFFQHKYGPVAKALKIQSMKHHSDVLDAKSLNQILRDSGCQVSSIDFLKALGQPESGITFEALKMLLTSQTYLEAIIQSEYTGYQPAQAWSAASESWRQDLDVERGHALSRQLMKEADIDVESADVFEIEMTGSRLVRQNQKEEPALSRLRVDEKRVKASNFDMVNTSQRNESSRALNIIGRKQASTTLAKSRPKSAVTQSSSVAMARFFDPAVTVRPKSAMTIRNQSNFLIRELSTLPFMKSTFLNGDDEIETVQTRILSRYIDDVKSKRTEALNKEVSTKEPESTRAETHPQKRPTTPSSSLLNAASAMDVLQSTVKIRHLDLSVFYARAKGVRPVVRTSLEIQKQFQQDTAKPPAQIPWVQILRLRNKSRLAVLKQHSQGWQT